MFWGRKPTPLSWSRWNLAERNGPARTRKLATTSLYPKNCRSRPTTDGIHRMTNAPTINGQVDSLELTASGLDLLPLLLRQFLWCCVIRHNRRYGWYSNSQCIELWFLSVVIFVVLWRRYRVVTAVVCTDCPDAGLAIVGAMRWLWRQDIPILTHCWATVSYRISGIKNTVIFDVAKNTNC